MFNVLQPNDLKKLQRTLRKLFVVNVLVGILWCHAKNNNNKP